jgi:hypothetical protein
VGANIRSQVYFRETYGVGVVIQHDPYSTRGYSILTAFPSNNRLAAMPWPDPERFEIACYHAWAGAEATYRLSNKEDYETVRRALDEMTVARAGGKRQASAFFPDHPGYYVIEEQDRAAFEDIMRDKTV